MRSAAAGHPAALPQQPTALSLFADTLAAAVYAKLETRHMHTANKLGPHTHTNRGTYPGLSVRLLQRPLHCWDSAEHMPSLYVVALGPDVTSARVLVHEVTRAEELAER